MDSIVRCQSRFKALEFAEALIAFYSQKSRPIAIAFLVQAFFIDHLSKRFIFIADITYFV